MKNLTAEFEVDPSGVPDGGSQVQTCRVREAENLRADIYGRQERHQNLLVG